MLTSLLRRAKRAKDEPRCEELRAENSSLTAHMFATKEVQAMVVQAVETLKTEKSEILKRKAGSQFSSPVLVTAMLPFLYRKTSAMKLRELLTRPLEHGPASFSRRNVSSGISLLWVPLLPKTGGPLPCMRPRRGTSRQRQIRCSALRRYDEDHL
jgi:hypothetical protein